MAYEIGLFDNGLHREQVITLWNEVFGYETAHNDPGLAIDRKVTVADELFFVATEGDALLGTIMAGYDGHRGWIYSMAVAPGHQRQGIGSALLAKAEAALTARNCLKINLQILEGNPVESFYTANGYDLEPRINMGKKLFKGSNT